MSTAQTQEQLVYTLDKSHSTVEFVVRHMMISKVRGRFGSFDGQIELAPGSEIPQAVNVTVDASSIDTRDEQRDAHLRAADFFEVEKYPTLTFVSTGVAGTPQAFTVHGELTMHGVTKPVALSGSFEGRAKDPWGNERVAYSAHAKVNRKDFGLNWNAALETGGVLVSDEIRIEINVEAVLQQ